MTYENWKIAVKDVQESKELQDEYEVVANWCTGSGKYQIQQVGDEFKVVDVSQIAVSAEAIRNFRSLLYLNEVDTLMAEHYRKTTFNLFKEGEEAELLARVEAKVAEIKANNPYPEEVLTEVQSADIINTSETDINKILGD